MAAHGIQPAARQGFSVPPAPGGEPFEPAADAALAGSCRCDRCKRTLLAGEWVTVHGGANGSTAWACDPCIRAGRAGGLGPVVRRALVHTEGGAFNVKRAA
jgi:hypothetical protein